MTKFSKWNNPANSFTFNKTSNAFKSLNTDNNIISSNLSKGVKSSSSSLGSSKFTSYLERLNGISKKINNITKENHIPNPNLQSNILSRVEEKKSNLSSNPIALNYYKELLLKLDNKLKLVTNKLKDEPKIELQTFKAPNDIVNSDIHKGISESTHSFVKKNSSLNNLTLETTLKGLESQLTNLQKSTDLNGLDIDSLYNALVDVNFTEILSLLKEINKQVQVLKVTQASELKYRINHDKANSNDSKHLSKLEELLKKLNTKKDEEISIQRKNKEFLDKEVKNITNLIKTQPNIISELESRLDKIISKQEDILKNAVTIKDHILSESKQSNQTLAKFIEELKVNNIVGKESSSLNNKIHQDMEVIKKSILKLIDEQKKESLNDLEKINNKHKVVSNHKVEHKPLDKSINAMNKANEESMPAKESVVAKSSVLTSNKIVDTQKATKIRTHNMALGKLKEALDIDSISREKIDNKEFIDEIIEEKVNQTKKDYSNRTETTTKDSKKEDKLNTIENESKKVTPSESTLIFDTSKFFK